MALAAHDRTGGCDVELLYELHGRFQPHCRSGQQARSQKDFLARGQPAFWGCSYSKHHDKIEIVNHSRP